MARPNLRRIGATHGREVHSLAANACDEVGHHRCMWLALHDDALEVLIAAWAHKLQLDAVHANTVRKYSGRAEQNEPLDHF